MVKKGRGGKRGKDNRGGGHFEGQRAERTNTWGTIEPTEFVNEKFEEYYKAQEILPQSEWDDFMGVLKTELPTTFRVTGSRSHAQTISDLIAKTYVPTMQNVEHEGKKYDPPEQISWYPEQLAWQLSAPKRIVRKSLPFKTFQRFLVGETEVGNLSRQEAVSMIPPLLLDIQPHHACLDVCAAPGSKTAQMIESLNPHHTASTGLLIANDSDYKRCHMLVHQTGRMPSKGLMVMNNDASMLPNITLGNGKILQFDRILADVPCSGDGTMRKNFEIWKRWGTGDGNGLHALQLRILLRAMDLLKPGGRLVYSTCSFNPIENEAVVAGALNSRQGFKIIDASSQLPNLKRRPGLNKWKVAFQDKGGPIEFFNSYEDCMESNSAIKEKREQHRSPIAKTLWAPENVAELGLEKCFRLLPHDQNTGGFFVCVLEKQGPTPATNGKKTPMEVSVPSTPTETISIPPGTSVEGEVKLEDAMPNGSSSKRSAPSPSPDEDGNGKEENKEVKKPKIQEKKEKNEWSYKEDPFSYVDPEHPEIVNLVDYFKLNSTFPRSDIMVRNDRSDPLRVLYLTSPLVKEILENNSSQRLKLLSAGVKAFVRQDSGSGNSKIELPCKWRIPNDGLSELVPMLGQGIMRELKVDQDESMEVLRILITEAYPVVDKFPKKFKEWMEGRCSGNVIVKFPVGEGSGGTLPLPLILPLWKAKSSCSVLIDKKEKSTLSLRVFGEDLVKTAPPPKPSRDEKALMERSAEVMEDDETKDEEGEVSASVDVNGEEKAGGSEVKNTEDEEGVANA